jgi:hypothetical protein
MQIKISKCQRDMLVIEPCLPNSAYADRSILAGEAGNLKAELAKIDLIENRDYICDKGEYPMTQPENHIKFTGPSCVLRALFAIPKERICFELSYPLSPAIFTLTWTNYALAISDRECSVHELSIKEKVHNQLFTSLIESIKIVHQTIKKTSTVIDQLEKDLIAISKHQNDLWGKSNFYLACAALHHAKITEEKQKTVVEGKIKFLGGGTPVLFDNYKNIFEKFSSHLGYSHNNNAENKFQFLERCYKEVNILMPNALSDITLEKK